MRILTKNTFPCAAAAVMMILPSVSAVAQGYRFLTPGADVTSAAGAGGTISSGVTSMLYNPAGLKLTSKQRFATYGELSFMYLRYAYTYPDLDPTILTVATPLGYGGFSFRPFARSSLTLGFFGVPIPAKYKTATIKSAPIRMTEQPMIMDIDMKTGQTWGYTAAAAAALAPSKYFSLGLTVLRDQSSAHLALSAPDSDEVGMEVETQTVKDTLIAGIRFNIQPFVVGLAAKKLLDAKIATELTASGEMDSNVSATDGLSYNFAAEMMLGPVTPFLDVTLEEHITDWEGSRIPNLTTTQSESECYSTQSFAGGTKYKVNKRNRLIAAAGWYPTFLGNGLMAKYSVDKTELTGVSFGKLDGISRKVFSGGYQYTNDSVRFDACVSYHTGSRDVPETSQGYGHYFLQIFVVTGGLTYSL